MQDGMKESTKSEMGEGYKKQQCVWRIGVEGGKRRNEGTFKH